MSIRYTITSHPESHRFRVALDIDRPDPSGQVVSLPAWIPGSYLVRDFAKHIVELVASVDGEPHPVEKLDKQTWRIGPSDRPVRLVYTVYAWDLSVRKSHLDHTHGYFNGTSIFLRVHGQDDGPQQVVIAGPPGERYAEWRVATTLRQIEGEALGFGTFEAGDYDELIDHPVEMGTFRYATFEAGGIPHAVALTGVFDVDVERLCVDLAVICEGHLATMGTPTDLDRYLFQIMVVGKGYGGLEHRTSTSLICSRDDLPRVGQDELSDGYRTLLALSSHEYFHLWNVKRIKPARFTPFDLQKESPTTLLWAFEGITSYYEPLGLVRTGRITRESYLELLGRKLTDVMRRPGRHTQSVAASSFDAWTKFYQQDEDAPNAIVSYYSKGCMVALCLDLTLRLEADGRVSLDDVMRELYARHGETGTGVAEEGIQAVVAEVSGLDLDDFFAEALHGTGDALWERLTGLLARAGVDARLRPREGAQDRGGKAGKIQEEAWERTGWIGLVPRPGSTTVRFVLAGSPAERAGVAPGDQLVAIDGLKAGNDVLERISRFAPGSERILHVFRRDELHRLSVTVEAPPRDTVVLSLAESAPEGADDLLDAWMGGAITSSSSTL
ncbi:MAG: PDZ domain-containing protein [Myxococcota bacterium]